jgi:hypothetical protein
MRPALTGWRAATSWIVALTFLLIAIPEAPIASGAQESISALRARFNRETDPVHKARLMPQLGQAQFAEIRENVRAGRLPEALATLGQYRDEAETCERGLSASRIDAAKHPNGFKELEISVRESMRRLDEMVHGMVSDDQVPFLEIHKQLNEIDQRLVQQLFPRRS